MKTWVVSGQITIGVWTRIEAESAEQAVAEASERQVMSLCHQCAGDDNADEEFVTGGELDGEPTQLRAEST